MVLDEVCILPSSNVEIIYVDKTATGSGSGASWTDAYVELRDALSHAADPDNVVSEIWVAAGTYYPDEGATQTDNDRNSYFELPSYRQILGGFVGTESSVDERDPDANVTVLSADLAKDDFTGGSDADNAYKIDVPACQELIAETRPELIILGKSMVLHPEPVAAVRQTIDDLSLDCVLM